MIIANSGSQIVSWPGGRGVLFARDSTWNGAILTLTWCDIADGTFIPIGSGVSLLANGSVGFEMPYGYIKFAVSGGDVSTSIVCGAGNSSTARG